MKRILIFSIGFLGLISILPSSENTARAHTQYMSIGAGLGHGGYFYSHLRSYGEWIEVEPGFHAWRPVRVRAGWRPYLYGRWVWTDYGWYWTSYEPFGWAVFHYGRWYYDDYYGWIWIPDTVWGPAWVEWRYNNDYLGWAPLPPYASFSFSIGIRYTTRWDAPSSYWCFVRYRHFAATRIDGYVVDEGSTRRLIRTTRGSTQYDVDRDRVINRGVDKTVVERRGNLRINRTDVGETRDHKERIVRDGTRERVEVYRPSRTDLETREERIDARRLDRKLSLDINKIDRSRGSEGDRPNERKEYRPRTDGRGEDQMRERKNLERVPTPERKETRPEPRRDSNEQRTTPERRERNQEFRSSFPQRPTIQRTPERPSPGNRQSPGVRSEPKRESSSSQPSRRGSERGKRDR